MVLVSEGSLPITFIHALFTRDVAFLLVLNSDAWLTSKELLPFFSISEEMLLVREWLPKNYVGRH